VPLLTVVSYKQVTCIDIIIVNVYWRFLANGTLLMEYLRAVIKYNGIAFQLEHRYYGDSKPIKLVNIKILIRVQH
jgi:hypothetical protein